MVTVGQSGSRPCLIRIAEIILSHSAFKAGHESSNLVDHSDTRSASAPAVRTTLICLAFRTAVDYEVLGFSGVGPTSDMRNAAKSL